MNIAVIGRGFVGGSIEKFYKEFPVTCANFVFSYDVKDDHITEQEAYKMIRRVNADIIYVAVPTPMDSDGTCFTGCIEKVLGNLNALYSEFQKPTVLLKSTMVPGTTAKLQEKFPFLDLVTNPEFLTERNAYRDMIGAKTHVFGIPKGYEIARLKALHEAAWPEAKLTFVTPVEAELMKYLTNTYFSVKVSFANHVASLATALDIDYNEWIQKAVEVDPRIEKTHWTVPGHDGDLGFGGKCFPKDLNGMMALFDEHELSCPLLEAAWNYNAAIRSDKDWLRIEGATI